LSAQRVGLRRGLRDRTGEGRKQRDQFAYDRMDEARELRTELAQRKRDQRGDQCQDQRRETQFSAVALERLDAVVHCRREREIVGPFRSKAATRVRAIVPVTVVDPAVKNAWRMSGRS
jgi:hypothetical protein